MKNTISKTIPYMLLLLALLLGSCASEPGTDRSIDAMAKSDQAELVVANKIDELYDDYATYYTREEYSLMFEEYQGSFGGVGISMVEIDNEVVVYGILKNSPASLTDIEPGDAILAVDGVSLKEADASAAAVLIRGEVGETVTLQLKRASDDSIYEVSIVRDTITSETVSGINLAAYPGTAYISISSFNELTTSEFTEIYNSLYSERAIENLIFDLRSNGGGNFFAAIAIGEYFVPINELVVSEKTASGTESYRSSNGQLNDLNVIILQNAYTASASEVLIGAIKDEGHATLVGTTTFGKGITQNVAQLTSGSGHRYTRSIYYTPSGFSLHGIGLTPDIVVEDPEDGSAKDYFSYDPALNPHLAAALAYLFPDGPPGGDDGGNVGDASGE